MSLYLQLNNEYMALLTEQADKESISAEEFATRIVIRALDSSQMEGASNDVAKALSGMQRELARIRLVLGQVSHGVNGELIKDIENFRRDFSVAILALLVGAGQVETEEARDWVKENLRPLP